MLSWQYSLLIACRNNLLHTGMSRVKMNGGWRAGRKILCKRFSTKSRMVLESRADSGLNPLFTESHGGQNGMCAGTA